MIGDGGVSPNNVLIGDGVASDNAESPATAVAGIVPAVIIPWAHGACNLPGHHAAHFPWLAGHGMVVFS
jgi:hypothetical protein